MPMYRDKTEKQLRELDLLDEVIGLASQCRRTSEHRTLSEITQQEYDDSLTECHLEETLRRCRELQKAVAILKPLTVDTR